MCLLARPHILTAQTKIVSGQEDLALESFGGIVYKGVSLDGCYTINTMKNISGYFGYYAGSTEDGVATVFVDNYVVSVGIAILSQILLFVLARDVEVRDPLRSDR